jgi:putative sterol carrier protein
MKQFFEDLPKSFIPEKASGVSAVIQFNITGEGGGNWVLTIKDKKCTSSDGVSPTPTLVVSANAQDMKNIFSGKLDGTQAFMQGKLKIAGNMGLAMNLVSLFRH